MDVVIIILIFQYRRASMYLEDGHLRGVSQQDMARTYLQPHYGNGVFGNVYLLAGQR